MAERIKSWTILCRDFEKVIDEFDSRDTFFFCDPPYYGKEDMYKGSFKKEDHLRLKKALDNIEGKAMVCYYDHKYIRGMYKDYFIDSYESISTFQPCDPGGKRPRKVEIVIMNYEPEITSQMRLA